MDSFLLQNLKPLEGKELGTLSQKKVFSVLQITSESIEIKPHSSAETRTVSCADLEEAWEY